MNPKTSDWDQESPFLGEIEDWVQGDPLLGLSCTGTKYPNLHIAPDIRREDWCMATLAECSPTSHDWWLARWTRLGNITARQCRDIERLLGRFVP